MRGRETRSDLQQFLETTIKKCFTAKYTLLPKRREAVAPMEMDLWNLYKSQEDYFKGKYRRSISIISLSHRTDTMCLVH